MVATLSEMRRSDFVPFAAFARSGIPAFAMTAHVVYSVVDPDRPATTSRKVIQGVIRDELGFGGLLMSDDLCMHALSGSFIQRAADSLAAGCDVVLHCDGNLTDMEAVAAGCGPLGPNGMRALDAVGSFRGNPESKVSPEAGAARIAEVLGNG